MHRERFESLRVLRPIQAIEKWLNGEFGIDDEPAMIEAIRKDPRVKGSDEDISSTVFDALEEGIDAETCLQRLYSIV